MTGRRVAFVFARGGSKGVPNKNIRPLAGKPLIGYAIETALTCQCFDDVVVSTDSVEIAAVAREFGASVPFTRPAELATDTASEWEAWRHAIRFVQEASGPFDTFVSLPATSPFRNVTDVTTCVEMLEADLETSIVITGRRAERSPYFNMVSMDEKGYVHVVIPPEKVLVRRQDAPQVYDITTVAYVARPQFILDAANIWCGNVRMREVPVERALDIDTPHDFFVAECIAKAYPGIHLTR
ncbi:MAG: acylneuraminate cytidylyltransferase family protein [Rhizobium sp.]|nr:acylneuraminate cytidylyltransferase family protein [Rhizobium sp.]